MRKEKMIEQKRQRKKITIRTLKDLNKKSNGFKPKKKKVVIVVLILLLLFVSFVLYFFLKAPTIALKGGDYITLNMNHKYKEKGFVAKYRMRDVTKRVKSFGSVNVKKTGTYQLRYVVEVDGKKTIVKRVVKVVDKNQPEITLTGSIKTSVCPNTEYQEEGYKAIDDKDGDLTKKVKRKASKDKVVYTVKDTSSNRAVVTRKLKYEDKTAPVVTLTDGEVTLIIGNAYYDPGFQSIDNCDGDLSPKVSVSGEVNANQIGDYKVTYTSVDQHNNKTEVERVVHVVERSRQLKSAVIPNGKTIYLTFDDGPSPQTARVLDILKEEGVKATFFVINQSDDYNYLLKRIVQEGHTIALHSYSHNYKTIYSSEKAFFDDLDAIRNRVKNITGVDSSITRFPGGSSNTVSRFNPGIMSRLTKQVAEQGYRYFDWNVGSGDAGTHLPPATLINNVARQLGSRSTYVVLMHDSAGQATTTDAVRGMIQYGREHGYQFSRILDTTEQTNHPVNN